MTIQEAEIIAKRAGYKEENLSKYSLKEALDILIEAGLYSRHSINC
jgi:hypothetical protein